MSLPYREYARSVGQRSESRREDLDWGPKLPSVDYQQCSEVGARGNVAFTIISCPVCSLADIVGTAIVEALRRDNGRARWLIET